MVLRRQRALGAGRNDSVRLVSDEIGAIEIARRCRGIKVGEERSWDRRALYIYGDPTLQLSCLVTAY